MQAFLTDLSTILVPTKVWYLWRPGFSAPTDEMFVECAVASSADQKHGNGARHVHSPKRP